MKKGKLIHNEISHTIAKLGHTDGITIGDCGLPIPDTVKRIDLAVTLGVPDFLTVLDTVLSEQMVEEVILAKEIEIYSKEMYEKIILRLKELEKEQKNKVKIVKISHEEFKKAINETKAVIRTGECTPYTNIILKSGVVF
ncbi:D-ribose pyranase [Crassaminicella indica]|uniref:D-ribose pyranase n=1 Tax=Crassaminicella indica TaxID=2855394 RepID=A0ABX8RB50_9CLOT|nr:D-ribose pyranase [Crassaminicella indica]QXM06284.1 D-ribose pyranase [Crassaminicella indica]